MTKKITVAEIAREAGVSRVTASLALNRNPRILESTIRHVADVAERLNYRTLKERRETPIIQGKTTINWCLIFPYAINNYSYTPLDLLIIDMLENEAHSSNASLQISRLDANGLMPNQVENQFFHTIFFKSYEKVLTLKDFGGDAKKIILFGFHDNSEVGVQFMHHARFGVELIFDALLKENCKRILVINPDTENSPAQIYNDKCFMLQKLAESQNIPYAILTGDIAEVTKEAAFQIAMSKDKIALIGFRHSNREQECMKKIANSRCILGKNYECFVSEYDMNNATEHGFYYLDMQGKLLIKNAVEFSKSNMSMKQGQFLIPPRCFKNN